MSNYGVDDLVTFVAVARAGSFKDAAAALGRDASVISRRISHLERKLGVRLLIRTTRSLSLTEAGAFYFNRLRVSLDDLESASREVGGFAATPQGILKVSVPVTFGRELIVPVLSKIVLDYPQIKVDVQFTDRLVDIVSEAFDVVIRVGVLPDSSFQARQLGTFRNVFVAAPLYIQRHGMPETVSSLSSHACLGFTRLPGWPHWTVEKEGTQISVQPGCSMIADNSEGVLISAIHGTGIALLPDYMVAPHLASGSLMQVLPGWRTTRDVGVHALMPPGSLIPAKSRILVDELVKALSNLNSNR